MISNLNEFEEKIISPITEERWQKLATELIRTGQPRACDPLDPDLPSGEEEAIAMLIAGKLEALGMEVNKYESVPHRPNIVGLLKGSGNGPTLMMNDHMDTYPVIEPHKWNKTNFNPFEAKREGDLLYARGSSDTRGNLACTILAAQVLVEQGIKFKGDLMYCFCVDEERDGTHGSIFLTKEVGIKADYSITAEPTAFGGEVTKGEWGMNLSIANGGHCLIEIKVEGDKAHIWRPDTSNNAIVEASKLISSLEKMSFHHEPTNFMGHTPPCVTIVRIRGGLEGEMQFSPDECRITLAVVGIVPGMSVESIITDINQEIINLFGERKDITFKVKQVEGSLFVPATEPVPLNEEPCISIRNVYKKFMGKEPIPNRKNAFNDTIRFREAGINAVTFGPGEDGWAPDNESISITKAVIASKMYALAITEILGIENI